MTLLTTCAACGKSFQAKAKQCGRCKTPYCNATCQTDHWRREHKQMCKKIHRAGDAEQYHADKKYKEAVADAVEACAEDTKGQTCFICTEAIEPRTGEGLDEERVDAVATCEDCVRISLRVMGPTHPKHLNFQDDLRRARAVLALARGEIDSDACMEAFTRKNVGRITISC